MAEMGVSARSSAVSVAGEGEAGFPDRPYHRATRTQRVVSAAWITCSCWQVRGSTSGTFAIAGCFIYAGIPGALMRVARSVTGHPSKRSAGTAIDPQRDQSLRISPPPYVLYTGPMSPSEEVRRQTLEWSAYAWVSQSGRSLIGSTSHMSRSPHTNQTSS